MEKTNTLALPARSHMGLMCRKSIIENARKLLLAVVIYMGACLVLGMWFGYLGIPMGPIGFMIYAFFGMMVCAFIDSKTFAELTSKEGRIAMLMVPASAVDKYWTRVAAVVVGVYLLLFAGWYVLCCGNVLLLGIRHDMWIKELLNPFDAFGYYEWEEYLSLLVSSLWVQSLYILGSVAWPKHSFLKSTAVLVGFYLILILVAVALVCYARGWMVNFMSLTIIEEHFFLIWRAIILLMAAGMLWGGFKLFERKQII